jgi:type IV secretory pathway TrbL component
MTTKTKTIFFSLLAFLMMGLPLLVAQPANAQFFPDPSKGRDLGVTKTGKTDLVAVIFTVIRGLLMIVFAVAVLMFVISGIIFLTAANSDRSDMARDILTYAIVGLVVSVLGYAIVLFLSNVLIGEKVNGGGGGGVSVSL